MQVAQFGGIISIVYFLEVQIMFSNLMLTADPGAALMTQVVVMVVMFAVLYLFILRPQKKREKEVTDMRAALEVGDEIITRGGVIGRVVSLKEDTVMIETGSDRTKLRIARWAVEANTTKAPAK